MVDHSDNSTNVKYFGKSTDYGSLYYDPKSMGINSPNGNLFSFGTMLASLADYIGSLTIGPTNALKSCAEGLISPCLPPGHTFWYQTTQKCKPLDIEGKLCTENNITNGCIDISYNLDGTVADKFASKFMNNKALGNIPFLSAATSGTSQNNLMGFRGIVPGILQDVGYLFNPVYYGEQLSSPTFECIYLNLPTMVDSSNIEIKGNWITTLDLMSMDPCEIQQYIGHLLPSQLEKMREYSDLKETFHKDKSLAVWQKPLHSKFKNNFLSTSPETCGSYHLYTKTTDYDKAYQLQNELKKKEGFNNIIDKFTEIFSEKNLTEIYIIILGIIGLYLILKILHKTK